MTDYSNIRTFDELLEREHGKIGSENRNIFEEKAQMFIVSVRSERNEKEIEKEKPTHNSTFVFCRHSKKPTKKNKRAIFCHRLSEYILTEKKLNKLSSKI